MAILEMPDIVRPFPMTSLKMPFMKTFAPVKFLATPSFVPSFGLGGQGGGA
jgi:hypothetical protein